MLWHTMSCSSLPTFEISAARPARCGPPTGMIPIVFLALAASGAGALAACAGDDSNGATSDASGDVTLEDVGQGLEAKADSAGGRDAGPDVSSADASQTDAMGPDGSQMMDAPNDLVVNGDVTAVDADAQETADASDATAADGPWGCPANELCAQYTSQGAACLPSCLLDGGGCTGGMVCTVTSGCCSGPACSAVAVRVCCPASGC
jgi:hypothetical protein